MFRPEQSASPPETTQRWQIRVTGVVQGVGFRPFVYRLARRFRLSGFVGNDSLGVFIEVEGEATQIERFVAAIQAEKPPLAFIDTLDLHMIPLKDGGDDRFEIVASAEQPAEHTLISPDVSICDDCLHELFDPTDRRYRYPFINCTNCGPRFTIIQDIPYDRPKTTMAGFTMCPACQTEYDDPRNRRFHAQPNACPACGPQVWLEVAHQTLDLSGESIFETAGRWLKEGYVLAVKGLGGFHLAVDPTHAAALATLRQRKGRVDKPFAVMAADLNQVKRFAHLSEGEADLLQSKERPILILRKRKNGPLSDLVAPGNGTIGVMLPYTPLHMLLLAEIPILVMTSANRSNEPIVTDNDRARMALAGLADAYLLHDRPIENRCDDAVIRLVHLTTDYRLPTRNRHSQPNTEHRTLNITQRGEPGGRKSQPGNRSTFPLDVAPTENRDHRLLSTEHRTLTTLLPIRRARGYAPFPVKLPFELPPLLAVGGELKGTFCLAKDNFGYMSQHIGDVGNWETLQALTEAVEQYEKLFRQRPAALACDLHPGYLSSQWAERYAQGRPLHQIQHHHAHIASVMAENRLRGEEPVIGFAFDGTGYGPDGAIWGGEVLIADYQTAERFSHLTYVPLPGGDAAVKRPYRMALAQLNAAGLAWDTDLPAVAAASAEERKLLKQQLAKNLNCVPTSSIGRLFDAVAALAGGRTVITYEGQAAIELESLADPTVEDLYRFDIEAGHFGAAPLFEALVVDLRQGVALPTISAKFHNGLAQLILELAEQARAATGLQTVALSGGVFQNVTLLEKTIYHLSRAGFRPLIHTLVPPNDGGLALGQAVIAGLSE